MEFFTFAKSNLNLYPTSFEINGDWNERQAVLLYLSQQLHYLSFMHQKFSCPERIFIENVSLFIRGDMHLLNICLSAVYRYPAVLEVKSAVTDRLDFRAGKLDSCLLAFKYKIVVPCLAVVSNSF